MFLTLLLVTLGLATLTAVIAALVFTRPIDKILRRIVSDELGSAWTRYLTFAIIVVGVSSGVSIFELERYISPSRFGANTEVLALTQDRWILEIYRTLISTLQGIAWMLLVFFVFALIAFVIVRMMELKAESRARSQTEG